MAPSASVPLLLLLLLSLSLLTSAVDYEFVNLGSKVFYNIFSVNSRYGDYWLRSQYGGPYTESDCANICLSAAECSGYVHDATLQACTIWPTDCRGPTASDADEYPAWNEGRWEAPENYMAKTACPGEMNCSTSVAHVAQVRRCNDSAYCNSHFQLLSMTFAVLFTMV